jgi:PAS domain S-box-containing protein
MRQDQHSWWRRARKHLDGVLRISRPVQSHPACSLEKEIAHLKAEQADLQRRWQHLAKAQGLAHAGIFIWEAGSDGLDWSDEIYDILGVSPNISPTLDLVVDRVFPDDRSRVRELIDDCRKDGKDLDVSHRILMPDGETRHVHTVAHGGRDSMGNIEYVGVVIDITERKRAEEDRGALSHKLEESNTRLEDAQRVAHVGYWVWDLDTDGNIWSAETYRIYGLEPRKELIALAEISDMIHPDDRESVFRTADEAIRGGKRPDAEHRIIRPTGEVRIVHSLGEVKRDSSGHPYQMFGTVQDITDRKHAEEALQRSQFYLRESERLAHIGSWASTNLGVQWSSDMGLYWSDEIYRIYGLDPKDGPPTLEQYLDAIHPQDRASMEETIERMHEEHCGCDVTNRIIRPNGDVRYVRCVAVPILEEGIFKAMHGTTIDVTDHELLTQELRRERAYLAEAQRLTHTGSWACNLLTKQIFHSSDENARLYGFDPSQGPLPFDRFYNSILAEDESAIKPKLEEAITAGADYDVEFRIRRADGAIRFLRGIGHHTASQESGHYVGITIDITDLRRAEVERQKLQGLESELSRVNRISMMGEVAAALAHEIKQPIAAAKIDAKVCVGALAEDRLDLQSARDAAARMAQEAAWASDVVGRTMALFRKETQRELVSIGAVMREMAVLLHQEATASSISIRNELGVDVPDVTADRVQLQQVLMNLMLNAIDAMKDSGGELTIAAHHADREILISVRDTGVGLPANADQIFESFVTTKPHGTGMGLAIARSIVEAHGGRLWATSNDGPGATFLFALPADAT